MKRGLGDLLFARIRHRKAKANPRAAVFDPEPSCARCPPLFQRGQRFAPFCWPCRPQPQDRNHPHASFHSSGPATVHERVSWL
ncbi:hypothetical protein [Lysobacter gummosus]|uniref:hypothetical protein n=1 Tax=Lysobacter gummosus TaxID=262324 RepID=UPI00363DE678